MDGRADCNLSLNSPGMMLAAIIHWRQPIWRETIAVSANGSFCDISTGWSQWSKNKSIISAFLVFPDLVSRWPCRNLSRIPSLWGLYLLWFCRNFWSFPFVKLAPQTLIVYRLWSDPKVTGPFYLVEIWIAALTIVKKYPF